MNLANFANNLDSSGGVNPNALNAPTPISKGGTNAVTAAAARTNLDVYSTSESNALNPTGEIKMWPTGTAPLGFLLCNGASLSTTTYSALFAVIGYTFGGSGSSFNLPNFRDKMPIGAGATYAANASGGSKDAILVSHTHTATANLNFSGSALPAHTHSALVQPNFDATNGGGVLSGQSALKGFNTSTLPSAVVSVSAGTPSGTVSGTVTNSTAGVSPTDANLPPYLGIYFIIKT